MLKNVMDANGGEESKEEKNLVNAKGWEKNQGDNLREFKAKVVRGEKERIYMGELIQKEYFEKEKLSQGESQTQKWKSKIASCFYFSSYT